MQVTQTAMLAWQIVRNGCTGKSFTQICKELRKEVDEAFDAGRLSSPVKYSEAIKLLYSCACIKEKLGIHLDVPLTMDRTVPSRGLDLCETCIPEGYWVGMEAAAAQFGTSIFGADASQFRPRRWLEGNAAMMGKHFLALVAGTRTCIGKLVPELLRHFELELNDSKWKALNR